MSAFKLLLYITAADMTACCQEYGNESKIWNWSRLKECSINCLWERWRSLRASVHWSIVKKRKKGGGNHEYIYRDTEARLWWHMRRALNGYCKSANCATPVSFEGCVFRSCCMRKVQYAAGLFWRNSRSRQIKLACQMLGGCGCL
jgi:hypothetical protein